MSRVLSLFQGTNASALEKDIGPEQFPINEHYFGLVNVSITKSSRALTKVIAKNQKTLASFFKTNCCESCPRLDRLLFVRLLANIGTFCFLYIEFT